MKPQRILPFFLSLAGLFVMLLYASCDITVDDLFGGTGGPTYTGPGYGFTMPECSFPAVCIFGGNPEDDIHRIIAEAEEGDSLVFDGINFEFTREIDLSDKKNLVISSTGGNLRFNVPGGNAINIQGASGLRLHRLNLMGSFRQGVLIDNSTDISLTDLFVDKAETGLLVRQSQQLHIIETTVQNAQYGMISSNCSNLLIGVSAFNFSWTGLLLEDSRHVEVVLSDFLSNTMGLVVRNTEDFEGSNEIEISSNEIVGNNGGEHSNTAPPDAFHLPGSGIVIAGGNGIELENNYFDANCQSALVILNLTTYQNAPGNPDTGYTENIRVINNYFNDPYSCGDFAGNMVGGRPAATGMDLLTDGLFDPSKPLSAAICVDDSELRYLNLNLAGPDPSYDINGHLCE